MKLQHGLPLTTIVVILFSLSTIFKLFSTLWLQRFIDALEREYTYVGDDYPETWPILRKSVLLQFDNPIHFRLDTEDGAAEWGALAPENGVIHLGPNRRPFTVAMMHQLKCMDVIRYEMVRERGSKSDYRGPSPLGRHCLNYLRQMITCHGDLELEAFQFATHKNPVDWRGVYECKDWEAVYNAVEINQKEYRAWLKEQGSE